MAQKLSPRQLQITVWALSVLAVAVSAIAWAQSYSWQIASVGTLQLFPLLGLVAFSLMWGHYIAAALRQHTEHQSSVLARYFEVTSMVVLVAILLHPGLLIWQLWRDGLGLPPTSTKAYVGTAAYWAVYIALLAWSAFMFYELRRFWGGKSWWKFVQYASDVAMFLIFIHALRLGGALKIGWFRGVWWFYGISLLAAIIYGYSRKRPKP